MGQDRGAAPGWRDWPVAIAVVAGLGACLAGIHATGLLATSHWLEPRASARATLYLVALLAASAWFAMRVRRPAGLLMLVAGLALSAAFAGLGAVAALMLQLFAAFCIGRRIQPVAVTGDSIIGAVIAIAIGSGVLSLAVGLLAFLPVNNPGTYLLLLAVPIVFGWAGNREAFVECWRACLASATPSSPPRIGWPVILQGATFLALALRLLAVLHPEVGTDALAMHLVIADRLETDGRFHYDVTQSIWAVMPLAADWQFALAHMLGGQPAARLLNFAADVMIVVLVQRHGGRLAGTVAAALYATTPLLYLETTSIFVENLWTLWVLAALLCARQALRSGTTRAAAAAGLLTGTAVAAKVMTGFLAPFFLLLSAAWIRRWRSRGASMLAAFAVAALLFAALPYANAWFRTGNPVFPFMNQVFGSPLFDASRAFDNPFFSSPANWRTLYDATFDTSRFLEALPGALGLAFMLFLPAAATWAVLGTWRARGALLCCLVFVVLVFRFQSYLRYVLPVLPVFSVLMGRAVASLSGRRWLLQPALALAAAAAAAGLFLTPTSNFMLRQVELPPFHGSEREEAYLSSQRPEQQLVRVIDAMQFRRVLWLGMPLIAGADTRVAVTNWHGGWSQVQAFRSLASADGLRQWIGAGKFDAIAVAADGNPCARPFVCEFLEADTTKVYANGNVALYVPDPALLYSREMLANGGFDHDASAWGGAGEYVAADGAVLVSADKPFSQVVPVAAGASYALEVEGRCAPGRDAPFRNQVNWLDAKGGFLDASISVVECSADYARRMDIVTAPAGAATAVVYVSGQEAGEPAEVTRVSFRQ